MKAPRLQVAAYLAKRSLADPSGEAEIAKEIAAFLLDAGRTSELDSLLRDIIQYRADHGIVEVTAVSASNLTASAEAQIKAQVKEFYPGAKDIIVNQRLEPAMLGGVRLEMVDKQLDLSIRNKLNQFKQLTTGSQL